MLKMTTWHCGKPDGLPLPIRRTLELLKKKKHHEEHLRWLAFETKTFEKLKADVKGRMFEIEREGQRHAEPCTMWHAAS